MKKILLTFTGFHDPYGQELVEGEAPAGPVLTLVRARGFDKVYLLSTPRVEKRTAETLAALNERNPKTEVEIVDSRLEDPTHYGAIFERLRDIYRGIFEEEGDAEYFVSVTSGTPQMHTCWVLLTSSGEIPARLLMTREERHVTSKKPLVQEINFTSDDFPVVRRLPTKKRIKEGDEPDLEVALRDLGIIGEHKKMRLAFERALNISRANVPVLILGQTGTGKELIARLIHRLSGREGKFVAVNCSAIPKDLAESELFGHVKGAFTGATEDRKGAFQSANGGTLFLDELGELPLELQAKLLRVIQENIVSPVGSNKEIKIELQILGATHRDLEQEIENGRFREDLFYRLSTTQIELPALRERKTDIPAIAVGILDNVNSRQKRQCRFTQEALQRLQQHNWPGNVRELVNVIESSVIMSADEVLGPEALLIKESRRKGDLYKALPEPEEGFDLDELISKIRKHLFLRALEIADNNGSKAARLLGKTPQAVHKFLKTMNGEA